MLMLVPTTAICLGWPTVTETRVVEEAEPTLTKTAAIVRIIAKMRAGVSAVTAIFPRVPFLFISRWLPHAHGVFLTTLDSLSAGHGRSAFITIALSFV